jgi:iron complex transport system substrate-binding protein
MRGGVGRVCRGRAAGLCRPLLSVLLLAVLLVVPALAGCVDQHPEQEAGAKPVADEGARIIATSMATVEIMERLDVDLVGVPHSDLTALPARYADVDEIGYPMSPDMELLASLGPDWVFSPITLEADLKPKYEAAGLDFAFLNLRSVEGMYRSIDDMGALLGREAEAAAMRAEYEAFLDSYEAARPAGPAPRVLILMGLPGSYIVATENSYVGSLAKMAGCVNVYAGESAEFIAANTEDMAARDPDIILRAAHALPEQVVEMFADEFVQNDIWKHFRAVKEDAVFDLPYEQFGMSAKFNYPEALATLDGFLYGDAAGAAAGGGAGAAAGAGGAGKAAPGTTTPGNGAGAGSAGPGEAGL